jgi:hypothetical protein
LGNDATIITSPLIIDRLPPTIGASLLSIGSQLLLPGTDGTIATIPQVSHKLSTSIIGGPIETLLTIQQTESGKTQTLPLHKNTDTGLWVTQFALETQGAYTLSLFARDGAGHTSNKSVTTVKAIEPGFITNINQQPVNATVALYVKDQVSHSYVLWESAPYEQKNPVKVTGGSSFNFIPPAGTYYIEVSSSGYKTTMTDSFTLSEATPLSLAAKLDPAPTLRVFSFSFSLPTFTRRVIPYAPTQSTATGYYTEHTYLLFPNLTLTAGKDELSESTIRSRQAVLTFINTWNPRSSAQLTELEQFAARHPEVYVAVVIPEEPTSTVQLYKNRGSYTIPMFADSDGSFLTSIPYHFAPTHYYFDSSGTSQKQITGILDAIELSINL